MNIGNFWNIIIKKVLLLDFNMTNDKLRFLFFMLILVHDKIWPRRAAMTFIASYYSMVQDLNKINIKQEKG